mmetsp:Transcript_49907/g.117440  ORF Transcript_49907/g.117440 Transcript_49907/m.117440 type:complete len:212 (+) Transcript_49907:77-712(+)
MVISSLARGAGSVALTALLAVLLAGCSEKPAPEPKSCTYEADGVAMAFTKPCDGSTPKQIPTPESAFMDYFMDNAGFVQFTLNITGVQAYRASKPSDFTSETEKSAVVVTAHLQPLGPWRQHPICVKIALQNGRPSMLFIQDDFACPTCSHQTANISAWQLMMQSAGTGFLCPTEGLQQERATTLAVTTGAPATAEAAANASLTVQSTLLA